MHPPSLGTPLPSYRIDDYQPEAPPPWDNSPPPPPSQTELGLAPDLAPGTGTGPGPGPGTGPGPGPAPNLAARPTSAPVAASAPGPPAPPPPPAPAPAPPAPAAPAPAPLASPGSTPILLIAGLSVLGLLLILGLLCAVFFIWRARRNRRTRGRDNPSAQPHQPGASPPPTVLEFPHLPKEFKDYEELRSATGGFSESNILGQGGFGTVYKGVLPPNNKIVAIKKLKPDATQGKPEFLTEVETISRAHHRHIVSLVGYYIGPDEAHKEVMMLVYEYIPNNSLDSHLHGAGTETIDWQTRMKIAIGSAKGLTYLHEGCNPKIIHRDIKSANILLLDDFQPKIADFGLAKPLSDTVTHQSLQQVAGTVGYLAPECLAGGKISEKSDVFAFGVVLLELITGEKPCRPFADGAIVNWARPKLFTALNSKDRNFEALADPRLQNKYNSEEMFRMVSCAANCLRDSANLRPRRSQVVDALEEKIPLDNREEVSPQGRGELLHMLWKVINGVDGSSRVGAYFNRFLSRETLVERYR
ncbi:proline-rich receptor-like protein kinase PERK1 [Neltuma alba]|uniref:proline-rich receptor-like protein kinase PERK1 n=1 Tax=Neltuma alba TaxID=207710 RepID=UPI0010A372F1|nr:proline-rich receptor-like protein kinase PERK1 [Prosopis alba]